MTKSDDDGNASEDCKEAVDEGPLDVPIRVETVFISSVVLLTVSVVKFVDIRVESRSLNVVVRSLPVANADDDRV